MPENPRRPTAKVYSRTGDNGTTGVRDGTRVRKDDPRLEACGAVDELNAAVGVAVACLKQANIEPGAERLERELEAVQQNLCTIETRLLTSPGNGPEVTQADLEWLENNIDRMNADLPALRGFILPGGGLAAAQLHVCRTICRRAERRCVGLTASEDVSGVILRYLNRLSDYFFVAARCAAHRRGQEETPWEA